MTNPQIVKKQKNTTFVPNNQDLTTTKMLEINQKIQHILSIDKDTSKGKGKETIMIVTPEEAKKIQKTTGFNFEGYSHIIDRSGVNHTFNHHGKKRENLRGQKIISAEDFFKIPEVIKNYNSIQQPLNQKGRCAKSITGNDLILYIKTFDNETIYYVEEIRTGKKELALSRLNGQN
jgi:mRNA-degrading endonuclease HigB of HigAB toxin-antitoxin module